MAAGNDCLVVEPFFPLSGWDGGKGTREKGGLLRGGCEKRSAGLLMEYNYLISI